MKKSEIEYNKRKKIIIYTTITGWLCITIGVWLSWLNKSFLILAFLGLGLMTNASINVFLLYRDTKLKDYIRRVDFE